MERYLAFTYMSKKKKKKKSSRLCVIKLPKGGICTLVVIDLSTYIAFAILPEYAGLAANPYRVLSFSAGRCATIPSMGTGKQLVNPAGHPGSSIWLVAYRWDSSAPHKASQYMDI